MPGYEPPLEDPEHLRLSKEAQGRPESTHPIRVSPNGRTFARPHHHPECFYYPPPAPERGGSLGFLTREDAVAAGHPPCYHCRKRPRQSYKPTPRPTNLKPGDRSRAISPKRVKERRSPEYREWDIARKRKARIERTPMEYEQYLERRKRKREGSEPSKSATSMHDPDPEGS